jgi:hypothetical protein
MDLGTIGEDSRDVELGHIHQVLKFFDLHGATT